MFADVLAAYAAQTGLKQAELAPKLNISVSLLRKILNGDRKPQREHALACDSAFGSPHVFERIYEEMLSEPFPDWFGQRVILEDKASCIHGWEMRGVPGLLQTPSYARAVIRACRPYDAEDKLEQEISNRLERQEILLREPDLRPKLWNVVGEGVLRQLVGGPRVMREQIDYLIAAGDTQGTVLQVLPFSAADAPGVDGPASLFEFADDPTVAYLEGWGAGRVVDDPNEVSVFATAISMIKSCALSPIDTRQLMIEIRGDL
jgi:transcriptional regulator with XRE-family HTH domain